MSRIRWSRGRQTWAMLILGVCVLPIAVVALRSIARSNRAGLEEIHRASRAAGGSDGPLDPVARAKRRRAEYLARLDGEITILERLRSTVSDEEAARARRDRLDASLTRMRERRELFDAIPMTSLADEARAGLERLAEATVVVHGLVVWKERRGERYVHRRSLSGDPDETRIRPLAKLAAARRELWHEDQRVSYGLAFSESEFVSRAEPFVLPASAETVTLEGLELERVLIVEVVAARRPDEIGARVPLGTLLVDRRAGLAFARTDTPLPVKPLSAEELAERDADPIPGGGSVSRARVFRPVSDADAEPLWPANVIRRRGGWIELRAAAPSRVLGAPLVGLQGRLLGMIAVEPPSVDAPLVAVDLAGIRRALESGR